MPIQGLVGYGGGATAFTTGASSTTKSYSVFFDGDNDYVTFADNAAYASGTGDFCAEVWCKLASTGVYQNILNTREAGGTAHGWTFSRESDGTVGFYDSGQVFTPAGSIAFNTWTHILVQRKSSVVRMMVDGVLRGYATSITNNYSNELFTIGINCTGPDDPSGAEGWTEGYLSNARYVVGSVPTTYQTSETSLGTTCFTVPTETLTTTSQGADSDDVVFLGLNATAVDSVTKSSSTMTVSGATGGHDGPF